MIVGSRALTSLRRTGTASGSRYCSDTWGRKLGGKRRFWKRERLAARREAEMVVRSAPEG